MGMEKDEKFSDLTMILAQAIEKLLNSGFELPLYAASVAKNGSVIFTRYTQGGMGLDAETLAFKAENDGFQLPINIMFVDSAGEAARVLIGKDGSPQLSSFPPGHA